VIALSPGKQATVWFTVMAVTSVGAHYAIAKSRGVDPWASRSTPLAVDLAIITGSYLVAGGVLYAITGKLDFNPFR
jgi:hypothetical protein